MHWRKRLMVGFGTALCLAAVPIGAFAGSPAKGANAAGGNNNKGDVWVDNVGQPPGPGHEQDPHLSCADINLWGAGLADGSGTYTIDGWPPSGSMLQAYPKTGLGNWVYDRTVGGDQVLDVINVHILIADAIANGDAPVNKQGFHFKLQFSQDPQKHKTFWVECPGPTPPPGPPVTPNCYPVKTVSPAGPVVTGTPLTYTITAINNTKVSGLCVLTDVLATAGGASLASPSAPFNITAGTIAGAVPSLTWTIPNLGAGATESFQLTGIATGGSAAITGTITNTATATSGCVATTAHPCVSAVITPIPPAAPGLFANCYPLKSVSPAGPVATGTLLTYTIKAINDSTIAGPCVLSDVLSTAGGASLSSPSAPFNITAGTISGTLPTLTWTIGNLAAGATESFQFTGTATGTSTTTTGTITNTATATSGCVGTVAHPCVSSVVTPIPPAAPGGGPVCTPAKTVSPAGSVAPGTELTYTLKVTNTGATGTCSVADVLGTTGNATFTVISGPSVTSGTVSGSAGNWTWTIPNMATNDTETLTVEIRVFGIGTVANTATVPSSLCTANCVVTVTTPTLLSLTKSVLPTGTVPVGTVLTYTITLTNTSANDITPATNPDGITVDDVMQGTAGFTVDTSSFSGSPTTVTVQTIGPGHYRWTYTTLAAGAAAVVTFRATITSAPGSVTTCLLGGSAGKTCLDNTASTAGVAPVTVENLTTTSPGGPGSGVLGLSTTTPSTGAFDGMRAGIAALLFLGGLGLILIGLIARTPSSARRQGRPAR